MFILRYILPLKLCIAAYKFDMWWLYVVAIVIYLLVSVAMRQAEQRAMQNEDYRIEQEYRQMKGW